MTNYFSPPETARARTALAAAPRSPARARGWPATEGVVDKLFCSSQEKFRAFVLRGLRNISGAP